MTSSPPRNGTPPRRQNERSSSNAFTCRTASKTSRGLSQPTREWGCSPSPSICNPIHGLVRGFTYLKKRSPPPKRTLFLAGLPVPDGINNFMGTFLTHQRVGFLRRPCFGAKPLMSIRNPLHSSTYPMPSILHRP